MASDDPQAGVPDEIMIGVRRRPEPLEKAAEWGEEPADSPARAGRECHRADSRARAPGIYRSFDRLVVVRPAITLDVLPIEQTERGNRMPRSRERGLILAVSYRSAGGRVDSTAEAIPLALPRRIGLAAEDIEDVDGLPPVEQCGAGKHGIVEVRGNDQEWTLWSLHTDTYSASF